MADEEKLAEPLHPSRVYRQLVSADKAYFRSDIDIRLFGRIVGAEDRYTAVGKIIWESRDYNAAALPYSADEFESYDISLRPAEAQALIDDLYRCGIRPTNQGDEASALEQALAHIETLQAQVYWMREWIEKMSGPVRAYDLGKQG